MNFRIITLARAAFSFALLRAGLCLCAQAQSTAFTYQGVLSANGAPASGLFDLQFGVFDAPSGGSQQGATFTTNGVAVSNGLFTVTLDPGANVFGGGPRWLLIRTRPAGQPAFTSLSPLQAISATPYAILAANVPPDSISAVQLQNGAITAQKIASGAVGASQLALNSVTGGHIVAGSVNSSGIADNSITAADVVSNTFWKTTGNASTIPGIHYLGTTDNQPLEFKVNGVRGLRIEPTTNSTPNFIAGAAGNAVVDGAFGATLEGGSNTDGNNLVGGNYGTVSGGHANNSYGEDGTIGGGFGNGMGRSGVRGTIAGGYQNQVIGPYGTVPGGAENVAGGDYSFAAGHRARANHNGSFVWADSSGSTNFTSTGTNQFLIRAAGGVGINTSSLNGDALNVNGNQSLSGTLTANDVTIATVLTVGSATTVGGPISVGGKVNVGGSLEVIGSGTIGTTLQVGNSVLVGSDALIGRNATVAGEVKVSQQLKVQGGAGIGTLSPQTQLHVYSTTNPTVARIQSAGAPGFGRLEFVSDPQGSVNEWRPGYIQSLDAGGFTGGLGFFVNGAGAANKFGDVEVMRALAGGLHVHTTVYGSNTVGNGVQGNCTAAGASGIYGENSGQGYGVAGRTSGTGVAIYGDNANSAGWAGYFNGNVRVTGTINPPSDRNVKHAFEKVDSREVLEKLAALSIQTWAYTNDSRGTRHLGPVAQDFQSTFGLGADDKSIATVDADGVALAAIQGLNQKLEETRAELRRRDAENAELRQRLEALERVMSRH